MSSINPFNLRKLKERKGFTLDRLAELSGINRTTINRIECGLRARARIRTVENLAKALDVEPSDLTGPDIVEADDEQLFRPTSQFKFHMANDARNALDLVAERYGVKPQAILHLAPFLFLCAAEQSLQKRSKKLQQAHERIQELFAASMPLHIGDALINNWRGDEVLEQERQSIASRDIFGERINGEHHPSDYDLESENPFIAHLIEMGEETFGLARFDSWSQFMALPEYELLEDEIKAMTGNDHKATRSIIDGAAALYRMPSEIRKGGARQVADWARTEGERCRRELFGDIGILLEEDDDDD